MGFMDEFRRGRTAARAARGAPPLDWSETGPDAADDTLIEETGQHAVRIAELEAALREVTGYAEEIQNHATELETVAAPLAAALLIPGVKTMLVNRFHPDKHPEATDEQRAAYGEALRVINEAYAVIDKIQTNENQS